MKTRNLLIAMLLISGLAFTTACHKDNSLMPETSDAEMKSHQTGQIWSVEADPLTNFPDPFIESTTIEYRLNKAGTVRLAIVDGKYASVAVLVDAYQKAGVYQVEFDASNLKAGTYIAMLRHGGVTIKDEMRKVADTNVGNPLSD